MKRLPGLLVLVLVASLLPVVARAAAPDGGLPLGVVVSADLGGGGAVAAGSRFGHGIFEAELAARYELVAGSGPELTLVLGGAPDTYAGVRLGIHAAIPGTPFYGRGAVDASTVTGSLGWRWLLAGAGAELRVTGVLGAFAEADLGLPLKSGAGVPVLVRAGVTFRL